jgi:hypothetical protein
MRRIVALLGVTIVMGAFAASSATAAPSDVKVGIDGQAQFVSPTTLQLPITYVCPATLGTAFINVSVSQVETGANGFGSSSAPCTGEARTVVVSVMNFGMFPWVLDQALATASLFTAGQSDSHRRRIQVVL